MVRRRIIPIFVAHLGCPHRCVFCDQKRISGVESAVTPEGVAEILCNALPKCGPGAEVAFYGGSFTAVPPAYQEALLLAVRPFLQDGLVSSIRVSTRPDAVTPEALDRLQRFGVQTVELGCQSMDDTVLRKSGRGHDRASVVSAVAMLRSRGFQIILQMMTGLPGDSGETSLATAQALASLHPDGVRIYPTVVLRGTELEEAFRSGAYVPQSVEEAVELCAGLLPVFLEAGIPILRIGLQPTASLDGGAAVAGAYHPALGELVLSRFFRNRAENVLRHVAGRPAAGLGVAPHRISVMTGQKRCNLLWLQEALSIGHISVTAACVGDWQICLQSPLEIGKITR